MATVIDFCGARSGTRPATRQARGSAPTAEVGDRFRFWQGRSGRRHVFTRIESDREAVDLDGAVLVVARRLGGDVLVAERVLVAAEPPEIAAGRELWAHFLAETDADRHALMRDLSPTPGGTAEAILATSRAA